ncbi:putative linoleate 13S-lipoxygenase [Lupinus albus]|uniref:Lipoxygenase n=1 Tax=Lupinus albus TaxID=3870 RepID=A0A6A4R8T7_LUPAL|nr:putative linoleate 13S-lipoxygenase [Lupinus albus]
MKAVMASSSGNTSTNNKSYYVKGIATIKQSGGVFLTNLISGCLQGIEYWVGSTLVLELVSNDLDPETNSERKTIKGNVEKRRKRKNEVEFEATFKLPADFGNVGAVLVENEEHNEVFLKSIVLHGLLDSPMQFITCDSWIQPNHITPIKRVFFTHKSYLPSQTPSGLRRMREEGLVQLRGNGEGERKSYERIYDYDVYNDLGDPDTNIQLKRTVLGATKSHPYPRRCRTGRPNSHADPSSEKISSSFYVPRDEAFSEIKQTQFTTTTISSGLTAILESLDALLTDQNLSFLSFEDIDTLYKQGFHVPTIQGNRLTLLQKLIPKFIKAANDTQNVFRFDTPEPLKRDKFFWLSDEEFARETLAGVNPYSIQLVKASEWPLRSKLEPQIYGPPESAITREVIEPQIIGYGTVEEAIEEKKLFMLDYHDLFLPYVNKVREIKGTTLYGSRTLFFLTKQGILKPLAIELTRPPTNEKPIWKQVFAPAASHPTSLWLWRFAKAHVLTHDSAYHELISHWLRTHCAAEPFVIATNRQLSAMHPIYRLLHPHLRYTMEINSLARRVLINSNGIIELSFSTNKYSMELSSAAYDKLWRFDLQALPTDLIERGMAVADPSSPHGIKLTIEDYPFANDGLLIWDAIKQWVTDYVNHYYPNQSMIESDKEVQDWWSEIRRVGHGDKSEEPWWPNLKTPNDLIDIITTIAWVTSAHHASVNFGQYSFGGYFPNRPTICRNKMPTEDPSVEEWENFVRKPEEALLECFPSQIQATLVMVVLNLLSYHSPDEEYIGQYMEPYWGENATIKEAFERFNSKMKEIEGIIESRNGNSDLKNRHGAGLVPYEVMKPFSGPGVTGKGVPYSISI